MTYNRVYLITYWTFCFRKECSVISQTFVATLEIKFQRSKAIYRHLMNTQSLTQSHTHYPKWYRQHIYTSKAIRASQIAWSLFHTTFVSCCSSGLDDDDEVCLNYV